MLMDGQSIRVITLGDGLYEVIFDLRDESVNKFNRATLAELGDALKLLRSRSDLEGVMFSSAKDVFVVGADITEFLGLFNASEEEIAAAVGETHALFNEVEDLPCPTVVAINGIAFGGGFELALACDYRVMSSDAKVGLPEVKLGINPGWGGTVRLPRLIGVDNANEWICAGSEKRAADALKEGAVDAVVEPALLREAALDLLEQCKEGEFDYRARRVEKQSPIKLNTMEQMMAFESARGVIGAKAGPHYPAPMQGIATVQKAAGMDRDKAMAVEAKAFAKLAKTPVAEALIGLFLKDQYVKKVAKTYEKQVEAPVAHAAVLGAGIMGGGIAYQSASKGVPILMKDIQQPALQLGMSEATKLLNKLVERGRMTTDKMASVIASITPTLSYGDFGAVDIVVEAVVENEKIKKSVLADVEQQCREDTVLASNTSTISITELATALKHPEKFCGMHFFNPVHRMPLVEVIRGEKTDEVTIAKTVSYAKAMGKTPIVVNDCPGFLVNRILFPYFAGFNLLLADGADFLQIDKVMEGFGWPMGPAYLLDVVGMDTAHHADAVVAEGYPDRMKFEGESAVDRMYAAERLGQKNGVGFYRYEADKKGRPQKLRDDSADVVLASVTGEKQAFDPQVIIDRMMIPLCIETVRCLEEGIVASAAEADMALIYGIGFPPFRGGALHYLDSVGLQAFCETAQQYASLGKLYQPTDNMLAMAAGGQRFFPIEGGANA